MSVRLELGGLENLTASLRTITDVDATPLMQSWMIIMEKDNREGILAGTDKDGVPMLPVEYRPKPPPGFRVTKPPKDQAHNANRYRLGQSARLKSGTFSGLSPIGPGWVLANNNLRTSEYQQLAGPPLAPRDQFSRVITNYKTDYAKMPSGNWVTTFWWDEVVDTRGRPFLHYHFNGIGQKRRDLRGIRPGGIVKALDALRNWARLAIREHFGH